MVVAMKKLQVLLPAANREAFLTGLAGVGVVHIEEHPEKADATDLDEIVGLLRKYQRVYATLSALPAGDAPLSAPLPFSNAEEVYEEYMRLDTRRTQLTQALAIIDKDKQQLKPWGNFDPKVLKKLAELGITVTFHEVPARKFGSLALSDVPHAVVYSGNTVLFVVFHYKETHTIDCDRVTIPMKSLFELREDRAQKLQDIDECTSAIAALAPARTHLADAIATVTSKVQFERARMSMEEGANGALLLCNGWFPAQKEHDVKKYLDSTIAWYECNDPAPDDTPPIKLSNSAFANKFEPVTRMFALPSYNEIDPTPFFAPFFMFFYGMCLGDVGYGAVVFITALVLTLKTTGKLKPIFILGMFLGGATILNGFFLNSFFGASLFDAPGVKGLVGPGGGIPFLGSRVEDGKTIFPAMTFAVYIGIVQMLLGMLLQTINKFRSQGVAYAIQPFCYLPLTLAAFIALCQVNFLDMGVYTINTLHIGEFIAATSQTTLLVLLGAGIIPFIFFNKPASKVWWRPLTFLWEFYNFVNGIVSYGLSYLRLFALGLAGGLLGNAFNQIALMIITDSSGNISFSPLIIFTILIMLAGHALNFALSALGAYVHTVRLTFVEFYGALSFAGGGKPYAPFTSKPLPNQ